MIYAFTSGKLIQMKFVETMAPLLNIIICEVRLIVEWNNF